SVMLINSCSEDKPCDGVTCSNQGTPTEVLGSCSCDCNTGFTGDDCECFCNGKGDCVNHACACDAGYEGDSCQTVSRTRFVYDNYAVTEVCSGDSCGTSVVVPTGNYASDITAGVNIDEVKIENFG